MLGADVRGVHTLGTPAQPGKLAGHPLHQADDVQCRQLLGGDIYGTLPALKAVAAHEMLDILVRPFVVLRVSCRLLVRIPLPERLLVEVEGNLFSAVSHTMLSHALSRPGRVHPPHHRHPARHRRRRSP